MVKFGQSSRDFLFGGPQELMPEEGLSKAQRHEMRLLKVCCRSCHRAAGLHAACRAACVGLKHVLAQCVVRSRGMHQHRH